MTLAQQFILTTVLGAVLWSGLGYMVATVLHHKRNSLVRYVIKTACAEAKRSSREQPRAADVLNLMDLVQEASGLKIFRASYAAIQFEWVADDPTD